MTPEFPSTYSRLLVRELRLDEAGVAALLAGSNVTPEHLFQLDTRIGIAAQIRIIDNALALSGNPALGLQVGSRMPHAAHGALGVALSSAPTLRQSMEVVGRFQTQRIPVVSLGYRVMGDDLYIDLRSGIPVDGVGLFLLEVLISSIESFLEGSVGSSADPGEVRLGYPAPPHAARYPAWIKRPLSFGHAFSSIRLPVSRMDAPNPFADPEVFAQAVRQCERVQADLQSHDTWCARVTRLLQRHPGQIWTSDEVAAALHVSVRSLARHLSAEGSSYQTLLDQELMRQAQIHLESPGHTVTSVASALGYHDVSAFRRAFKRWTGATPQAWLSARRR